MPTILHITQNEAWQQAEHSGEYRADSLAKEGFIHCSTSKQLVRTANKHYAGKTGLVILCIDESKVKADVRYEDFNAGDLFPHIYGPLNLDAVMNVIPYTADRDGKFGMPEGLNLEG